MRGLACHRPYGQRGALLPHLFTLTHFHERYIFCATFLQVTLTGCYPAHRSLEFGLSSMTTLLKGSVSTAVTRPTTTEYQRTLTLAPLAISLLTNTIVL